MIEILLSVCVFLLLVILGFLIALWGRKADVDLSPLQTAIQNAADSYERIEKSVRDEIAKNRVEYSASAAQSRDELAKALKAMADSFNQQIATLTQSTDLKLGQMRETIEQRLTLIQEDNGKKLDAVRQDSLGSAKVLREEIGATLKTFNETLIGNMGEISKLQKGQLDVFSERLEKLTISTDLKLGQMRETIEQRLTLIQEDNGKKLDAVRQDSLGSAKVLREEIGATLKTFNETLIGNMGEISKLQKGQLDVFSERLEKLTTSTDLKLGQMRETIEQRLTLISDENGKKLEAVRLMLEVFRDSVLLNMQTISENQKTQLEKLIESNQQKLDALKTSVEEKLKALQEDNTKQLDLMRATVDEKLQGTLEKRLGESFKQVSQQLEAVYKGLGEMQVLATGVGDLKKVLTNVKVRGTWGEVQLGALLEQVLNPDQYAANVSTKDSLERVEYAIKLPGRTNDSAEVVWLPIDAKFPMEDYQRLVEAQDCADKEAADDAAAKLEGRIKLCASYICDKYLNPPQTTDFGILFLPTEGLFAEVIRRPGLPELLQQKYRVVIAGPTTLWSILNSLQMGFRTLSIQQRSSEVWKLLAAVKSEWSKYGAVLDKVQKKLQEASNTMEDANKRTRAIGRKLKDVEEMPTGEAEGLLLLSAAIADNPEDEPS